MFSIYSISPANWLKIACVSVALAGLSGFVLSGYRLNVSNANESKPSLSVPSAKINASITPKLDLQPIIPSIPEPKLENQDSFVAPVGILDSNVKFAALEKFDDTDDTLGVENKHFQSELNLPSAIAPTQILDPGWKGNSL